MRLTILAGTIMGVALAIQSVLSAHASEKVVHAASAVHVHQSAPWYIAMNDGHSADARGARAGRPGAKLI